MIVTCPQCSTQYNVPLTALPPAGRKTRCAKCGHVWLEGAPPEEAISALAAADAVPAPPAGLPDPIEDATPVKVKGKSAPAKATAAKPPKVPKSPRAPLPWGKIAASGAFIFVTFVGAGLMFRESLARATPGIAQVYAKVGVAVGNVDDWFKRTDLKPSLSNENGEQILKITGTFQNISTLEHSVPNIRVFWQSPDDKIGPVVTATVSKTVLEAGESTTFTATLTDIDLTAGGQVGAVLEGGRYDTQLKRQLRDAADAHEKNDDDSHGETKPAAAASKGHDSAPAAKHEAGEH